MSGTDLRPPPVATPETAPFWQACARGELLYQSCRACGHVQFPPRPFCVSCRSAEIAWKASGRHGRIHSFTVVRRPPTPAFRPHVPYVLALVDLDEGFRMMMNVEGAAPDVVRIGQRVEIVFEDRGDGGVLPQARIEEN